MALINFLQHVGEDAGKGITSFPFKPEPISKSPAFSSPLGSQLPQAPQSPQAPQERPSSRLAPAFEQKPFPTRQQQEPATPASADDTKIIPPEQTPRVPASQKKQGEFEVNLIPTGQRSQVKGNGVWYRLAIACIAALVITEGVAGYVRYEVHAKQGDISTLGQEIESASKDFTATSLQSKSLAPFSKKLTLLATLLDAHVYWSPVWDILEKHTLPNVYYVKLLGDEKNGVIIDALGKDLVTVAQQLVAFRSDPAVQDASIVSLTFNKETIKTGKTTSIEVLRSVGFSVAITFKDGTLSKPLHK